MSLGSSKSLIIKDFDDFHEIHGFPSNSVERSSRSGQPRPSSISFHIGKLLFRSVSKSLSHIFWISHGLVCGSLSSRSIDVAWIVKILDNQWKSMKINENQWKSMKISENQWKSMINCWFPLVLGDVQGARSSPAATKDGASDTRCFNACPSTPPVWPGTPRSFGDR